MRRTALAAVLACALTLGVAAAHSQSGDIVINSGKSWVCHSPVDLNSVTVEKPLKDAAQIKSGCTGYIGSITVDTWHGDGIKIGTGAHDLTIGSINVHCYAHDAGKHQDGVQAMGGSNITVNGGYVGCYSANDSQIDVNEGASQNQAPTSIVFNNVTVDPAGVQDPTGQPLYHYGAGGAYGITIGQSASSGVTNLTLLSLAHRHDLFQGAAAQNPVWSFLSLPAGVRANFPIP